MIQEEDIHKVLEKCYKYTEKGESKFFNMTYEEGVVAALEWVLGIECEEPMEE